jgi:hypothetical protein
MADVRRGRGPYVVADDDLEEDAMGVVGESALGQLLGRPAIWSDGVGAVGESFCLAGGNGDVSALRHRGLDEALGGRA